MVRISYILIILLLQFNLKAEFQPMTIHEMMIKSDKIVSGEIINLDSTHFELKIKKSLTGDNGIIRIRKFENWTCAWRWTKYEKGQNLLVFVRKWNNEYHSMGAGNEGELPIIKDEIYINGLSLMYVNGDQNDWKNTEFTFEGKQFDIHEGEFWGTKMTLSKFLNTTRYVRQCINFEYDEYYRVFNWKFNCESEEMKNRTKTSLLFKAIIREAKERRNER